MDLKSRLAEGEVWLDEAEFTSQFDDITVGYPMSEEGHLKSIYTGYTRISLNWSFTLSRVLEINSVITLRSFSFVDFNFL